MLTRLVRRGNRVLCLCKRYGSNVARPELPPPFPVKNLGEYIEPTLVTKEHVPPMYRDVNPPSKRAIRIATVFGMFMWTWILLGFYYEPDHITGHYPWPDPQQWTDKELGIPDDLEIE